MSSMRIALCAVICIHLIRGRVRAMAQTPPTTNISRVIPRSPRSRRRGPAAPPPEATPPRRSRRPLPPRPRRPADNKTAIEFASLRLLRGRRPVITEEEDQKALRDLERTWARAAGATRTTLPSGSSPTTIYGSPKREVRYNSTQSSTTSRGHTAGEPHRAPYAGEHARTTVSARDSRSASGQDARGRQNILHGEPRRGDLGSEQGIFQNNGGTEQTPGIDEHRGRVLPEPDVPHPSMTNLLRGHAARRFTSVRWNLIGWPAESNIRRSSVPRVVGGYSARSSEGEDVERSCG